MPQVARECGLWQKQTPEDHDTDGLYSVAEHSQSEKERNKGSVTALILIVCN